jgi:4'-phosphopantetheinyl transferase EntD
MIDVGVLAERLRTFLPANVAFGGGLPEDGDEHVVDDERLRNASTKRRREFGAGRRFAGAALAALGCPPVAIPIGEGGAPVWPDGVVGSIAHCERYCLAIAARTDAFAGLGVDVEIERAVTPELTRYVRRDDEHGIAQATLFVIKESVYKAYAPLARTFLDFHDVRVRAGPGDGTFETSLVFERHPAAAGARTFHGRFFRAEDVVIAYTAIPLRVS